MNRNVSWPTGDVRTIGVHIAWASLELIVDDTTELRLLISGDDADVQDVKVSLSNAALTIEQPAYGLSTRLNQVRWMQLILRVPRGWKGAVDADTIAGLLKARGLSGSDINLSTVSGDLRAHGIEALSVKLHTVTGVIGAANVTAEKLSLRTVSGRVTVEDAAVDACHINSVSGDVQLELRQAFRQIDGSTVSGDVSVTAPVAEANALLRTVSGRLRTNGVSIVEGSAPVTLITVSGSLSLNTSGAQAAKEADDA